MNQLSASSPREGTVQPASGPAAGSESVPGPGTARDRAYQYTKARVLEGVFEGGRLISENEVALDLGVSRTPVRDAFLRLESEDLLRLYPKRGAVVVSVSAGEIRAVLEARELIELFAAARVASLRLSERQELVTVLESFVADQDQAVVDKDDAGFARADRSFHESFVAAAANPILKTHYAALRDRQVRMNLEAFRRDSDRTRQNRDDHRAIMKAITRGDAQQLGQLLTSHVNGIAGVLGVHREPMPMRLD